MHKAIEYISIKAAAVIISIAENRFLPEESGAVSRKPMK